MFIRDFIDQRSSEPARADNFTTLIRVDPASWIQLQFFSRIDSDSFTLREVTPMIGIRNGDLWSSRLYLQSLQNTVNQVYWLGDVAVSRNNRFLFSLRYNGQNQQLTEQKYGIQRKLGNSWLATISTVFRRDNVRQSDFQFEVSLTSLLF